MSDKPDERDLSHIPANIRPFVYRPGQSGNPAGKIPGTFSLRKKIQKMLSDDPVRTTKILEKVIRMAEIDEGPEGYKYTNLLIESVDGKLPDRVQVSQEHPDLTQFTTDELLKLREITEKVEPEDIVKLLDYLSTQDPQKLTEMLRKQGDK